MIVRNVRRAKTITHLAVDVRSARIDVTIIRLVIGVRIVRTGRMAATKMAQAVISVHTGGTTTRLVIVHIAVRINVMTMARRVATARIVVHSIVMKMEQAVTVRIVRTSLISVMTMPRKAVIVHIAVHTNHTIVMKTARKAVKDRIAVRSIAMKTTRKAVIVHIAVRSIVMKMAQVATVRIVVRIIVTKTVLVVIAHTVVRIIVTKTALAVIVRIAVHSIAMKITRKAVIVHTVVRIIEMKMELVATVHTNVHSTVMAMASTVRHAVSTVTKTARKAVTVHIAVHSTVMKMAIVLRVHHGVSVIQEIMDPWTKCPNALLLIQTARMISPSVVTARIVRTVRILWKMRMASCTPVTVHSRRVMNWMPTALRIRHAKRKDRKAKRRIRRVNSEIKTERIRTMQRGRSAIKMTIRMVTTSR